MKDQIVFDTTVSDADRDNIGAYLRSSDGTLLTHTTVGGREALDVYVANDLDIDVDLDHTEDSVRLGDGTNFLTSTTNGGDIGLDVNLINDNIEVTQGTSPWVIGDGGGSITVDAVDLDIRDLSAAQDNVASWTHDGTGTAITSTLVSGDQALDVNVSNAISIEDVALADTDLATTATSVTTTAGGTNLIGTALTDRKYLFIHNEGNRKMYIGKTGVTTATGFPVSVGSRIELRAGAALDLYGITATGTADARMLELS